MNELQKRDSNRDNVFIAATTNVRLLGCVKNCLCKNIIPITDPDYGPNPDYGSGITDPDYGSGLRSI